ncbi:MAG: coenzyme F420-0:L-glutamate ligase [bacterium]|nr:coenzyme F420-0:L-glutamate ligase [bacterium]
MHFIPIKTRALIPPKDDIYQVIDESLPQLHDGDVVLVTSKVVSIHEGRCIPVADVSDKDALIIQEAEHSITREYFSTAQKFLLTIKHNTLIPSSGIDESNAKGHYILWPKDPSASAREICLYLRKKYNTNKLAVIVTDSHTTPLRWGVTGIAIGSWGLEPLHDYRGTKDIFGRVLEVTRSSVIDPLAAAAVMLMGEGAEQQPFVIVRGAPHVVFTDTDTHQKIAIALEDDLYAPLLKIFKKYK